MTVGSGGQGRPQPILGSGPGAAGAAGGPSDVNYIAGGSGGGVTATGGSPGGGGTPDTSNSPGAAGTGGSGGNGTATGNATPLIETTSGSGENDAGSGTGGNGGSIAVGSNAHSTAGAGGTVVGAFQVVGSPAPGV